LIQPHIKKCFEGIKKLDMEIKKEMKESKCEIHGMISPDGEKVDFHNKVTIEKLGKTEVEHWLEEVENAMMSTLKKLL
jgi:dynein heavy chain